MQALKSPSGWQAWVEIILAALFVAAISLPLVRMVLPGSANQFSAQEQAMLAPPPKIASDLATITAFPGSFKSYFRDNFSFRKTLIYWQAAFKHSWLKVSSTPSVILGKDGWLFLADEASLASLRNATPFTQAQLAQWKSVLESRNDVLKRHGIPYLVVIAPDKHTIYPEYVPAAYSRINQKSRREQLVEYLQANSQLPVTDLTPALKTAKSLGNIYFKTDTHWNGVAAFIAHQEIGKQISNWYPQFHLRAQPTITSGDQTWDGGDLARMIGLPGGLPERLPQMAFAAPWKAQPANPSVVENIKKSVAGLPVSATRCPSAELAKGVVICDSFGKRLDSYLSEHFEQAIYLWGSYNSFLLDYLLQERPLVVIHEFVERTLTGEPPATPEFIASL